MSSGFCPITQERGNSDGLLAQQFYNHRRQREDSPRGKPVTQKEPVCGTERPGQQGRGTTHLSAGARRGPLSLHPGLLRRLRCCQVLLPSHKHTSKMFVLAATCRVITLISDRLRETGLSTTHASKIAALIDSRYCLKSIFVVQLVRVDIYEKANSISYSLV